MEKRRTLHTGQPLAEAFLGERQISLVSLPERFLFATLLLAVSLNIGETLKPPASEQTWVLNLVFKFFTRLTYRI